MNTNNNGGISVSGGKHGNKSGSFIDTERGAFGTLLYHQWFGPDGHVYLASFIYHSGSAI